MILLDCLLHVFFQHIFAIVNEYLHARNTECFRVCCRKRPRTKNLYLIWNVKAKKLVFIFQTIFCHRGGCYVTTTRTILPIRLGIFLYRRINSISDNFILIWLIVVPIWRIILRIYCLNADDYFKGGVFFYQFILLF